MQGFKSSNRCIDKGDVVCIDSGMLLSKRKKMKFCPSWMDLEGIMLSEISQRRRKNIV